MMGASAGPALVRLGAAVDESLAIVSRTETLWQAAPPASHIRGSLKREQLWALYEASFLRIFAAWEAFQEELTVRLMARQITPRYTPTPPTGGSLHRSQRAARVALYGSKRFLLWHDPDRSAARVARVLASSPLESSLLSHRAALAETAAIRHGIAHRSQDAVRQFKSAAVSRCGSDHRGRVGKFLRSQDYQSDPLNTPRWIRVLADELLDAASQAY